MSCTAHTLAKWELSNCPYIGSTQLTSSRSPHLASVSEILDMVGLYLSNIIDRYFNSNYYILHEGRTYNT